MYLFNGLSLWYLVGVGAEAWERVDCDGNVLQKASPEELLLVIKNLGEQAVESAAIRFINSYVNCENERYVKAAVSYTHLTLPTNREV